MNLTSLKTVFLDYDTVANGDLDTTLLRNAADDLVLYDSDESKIAERIRDADVALLNKLELSRELLCGAPKLKLGSLPSQPVTATTRTPPPSARKPALVSRSPARCQTSRRA